MSLQQFASHIFKRNQHVPCETITNSNISLALRPFSIFRPWRVHSLYPCDTWRKLRSPSCHHLASAEAMFDIAWIQGVTRFHLSTNLETGFHRLKMHQKGQNNGKVPLIGGTCVTDSSNKLHSRKLPSLNRSFKPYSQKTIPAFLSHVSRARFIILNQAEVTKHHFEEAASQTGRK